MAEVGSIIVNARMYTQDFSRGSKKIREEMAAISQSVESGQRSMRAFYETQARRANRTGFEQRVRDETAARIKAEREAQLAARVNEAVGAELRGRKMGAALNKGFFAEAEQMNKRLSLLVGGGAVAIFNQMAARANNLTKEIERIVNESESAEEAWREIVATSLRAIPIAGDIADAITRIGGILSGSAGEIERIKTSAAVLDEMTNAIRQNAEAVADAWRRASEFQERMANRRELIGKTGAEREFITLAQEERAEGSRITADAQKRIEEIRARNAGVIARLTGARNAVSVPMAIGSTGNEFGYGAGEVTNQKEITAAIAEQENYNRLIQKAKDRQAREILDIEKAADKERTELTKTMWAERFDITKRGIGGIIDAERNYWGQVWQRITEGTKPAGIPPEIEKARQRAEEIQAEIDALESRGGGELQLAAGRDRRFSFRSPSGGAPVKDPQAEAQLRVLKDQLEQQKKIAHELTNGDVEVFNLN